VSGSHRFAQGGIYEIKVTISDGFKNSSQTTTALVAGAGVHHGILQIIGTSEDDQVHVNKTGSGRLKVQASFFETKQRDYQLAGINQIEIVLNSGDDSATISGDVTLLTLIDGGNGNDRLNGGAGNSILLGGLGDDKLLGGDGRDLLIGGLGADSLDGGAQDDILVAGTTNYDNSYGALGAILARWATAWPYDQRRLNLSNDLNDLTIHDDDSQDKLTGGAGSDWFFASLDTLVKDKITGKKD
jgi:Ca2+-binding RTX toxin-like protein